MGALGAITAAHANRNGLRVRPLEDRHESSVGRGEQVRAMHWAMVLCHAEDPAQEGLLLDAARRWEPPASSGTHPVLSLERGITSRQRRSGHAAGVTITDPHHQR